MHVAAGRQRDAAGVLNRLLATPQSSSVAGRALWKLAEAYRTLGSGIYYEKPPQGPMAHGLYAALAAFLEDVKKQEAERSGFPSLKDAEIFLLLVFLWRVGKHRTNGRPRARAFLDFLRAQYPASAEIQKEAPKIIVP